MKWMLFLLFLLFLKPAVAQSIGVVPAALEFSGHYGEISEKQLIIYNPSEEEMHFSVEGPFIFSEKNGFIEAGGSRKIIASTIIPNNGKDESIDILGVSSGKGLNINAGVSIGAKISVIKIARDLKPIIGPCISASIVALGLAIFGAAGGFKKRFASKAL